MTLNVTILSGGTGSHPIIRGLMLNGKDNIHITNLINLYDDGKSTGVCRKVMNCLGPSDLRKVQFSHIENPAFPVKNFFTSRPNMTIENFIDTCTKYLDALMPYYNVIEMYECLPLFFERIRRTYKYNTTTINNKLQSFNVANVIYSTMFATRGVADTIKYFKNVFNIQHDVVINSYSNVELLATTINYKTAEFHSIMTEGQMVDLHDNVQIKDIWTSGPIEQTDESIECIDNADIIIISCGTPFSSIIPTLNTGNIASVINESSACKIHIANMDFDGDSRTFNEEGIYKNYNKLLDFSKFACIRNSHANQKYASHSPLSYDRILKYNMGKSTHDTHKLYLAIMDCYFNNTNFIIDKFNTMKFVFDFDGTIYDKNDIELTQSNIEFVSKLSFLADTTIITGNSIEHVKRIDRHRKFKKFTYNTVIEENEQNEQFDCRKLRIIANGANDIYEDYEYVHSIENSNTLKNNTIIDAQIYCTGNSLIFENRNNKCFSIKCKNDNRSVIKTFISSKFPEETVVLNGDTTIDIIASNENKVDAFVESDFENIVYFGDSEKGNDKEMLEKSAVGFVVNPTKLNLLLKYFTTIVLNQDNKLM